MRGNRDCTAEGGWLRLAGARGHVERVIGLSGLMEVLAYRGEGEPPAAAENQPTNPAI